MPNERRFVVMVEVLQMQVMLPLIFFVVLFVYIERKWTHSFLTVQTPFVGLKYVKGVFTEVLPPGRYRIRPAKESLTLVYMGQQYLSVGGQTIFTAEQAQIKMSLLVIYQIIDAPLAMHQQENLQQVVYSLAQLALREQVQQMALDACFKEAQATLERARGEQAHLRSLANAARQMEKNPMLLQLRWLQGLEQAKTSHTVHLSFSQASGDPSGDASGFDKGCEKS